MLVVGVETSHNSRPHASECRESSSGLMKNCSDSNETLYCVCTVGTRSQVDFELIFTHHAIQESHLPFTFGPSVGKKKSNDDRNKRWHLP